MADINKAPTGTDLGNISASFTRPTYIDYAFDGTNYYGFVTNNNPNTLTRLNFGSSLLNTPTATNLGSFGGLLPKYTEGIQVIKNAGNWYAIIVGGDPTGGDISTIAKIEFGTNIDEQRK